MKNSRMLVEYLYQFINTLDDKDLKKICSGEYKIILDKGSIENNKDRMKTKTSKKKSVTMDIRIVENLHKRVLSCKSRIEAKNVFEEYNLKKDELLFIGDYLKIKIPKSHNKAKVIEKLVEVLVGNKIDDECIL